MLKFSFRKDNEQPQGQIKVPVQPEPKYETAIGLDGEVLYNVNISPNEVADAINLIRGMAENDGASVSAGLAEASEVASYVGGNKPIISEQEVLVNMIASQSNSLQALFEEIVPKTKRGVIKRAFRYFEEDDLIDVLVGIKVKIFTAGFRLVCESESGIGLYSVNKERQDLGNLTNEDLIKMASNIDLDALMEIEEFQTFLKKFSRKRKLASIIKKLCEDFLVTDSMILYWRVDNVDKAGQYVSDSSEIYDTSNIIDINALSPSTVDWDNSFGRDILKVDIPKDISDKIRNALSFTVNSPHSFGDNPTPNNKVDALLKSGIPMKYIQAVREGKTYVILSREDGDNWLVYTTERRHHGLATPRMKKIFIDLMFRSMLKEGDFSASYMMKHLILHVTAGESIDQGQLAGQRTNWASLSDITNLHKIMSKTSKSSRMVTGHTVKFNFIFPPGEIFSGQKYEKHEDIIHDFFGVSKMITSGNGGKYAGGYMSVKRLQAELTSVREALSWIVTEFFDDVSISSIIKCPKSHIVNSVFDGNALKETNALLNELKLLNDNGAIDQPTMLAELGRNPDVSRRSNHSTLLENLSTGSWILNRLVTALASSSSFNQGNDRVDQQSPGRPPTEDSLPGPYSQTNPQP